MGTIVVTAIPLQLIAGKANALQTRMANMTAFNAATASAFRLFSMKET